MLNAEIEIIGSGSVGDKAQQLINKTPTLRDIGFCTPQRIILAEGFFDGFFQRNGFGPNLQTVEITPELAERIEKGSLTAAEFTEIQRVRGQFVGRPLAIRSSAAGDARGTGIYKSEFAENTATGVNRAIQAVLASYFTENAIAFRRDAHTGEGFGIIIEPIIGQEMGGYFAPILSGFGYTSTSRERAYVTAVPGIGGGVETRDGEKLTRKDIKGYYSLRDYLRNQHFLMATGSLAARRSLLLETAGGNWTGGDYMNGDVYFYETQRHTPEIRRMSFDHTSRIQKALNEVNLCKFFDRIEKMEQVLGEPQYFEWAMTFEDGEPKYWITQIADVNERLDILDFGDVGEILFNGHSVTGTGIKECSKIVFCSDEDDLSLMRGFNKMNANYILCFSSSLTTKGGKLNYVDCSNASVFLEMPEGRHVYDPIDHFKGIMDLTGKLFAIHEPLPDTPESREKIERRKQLKTDEGGLKVIKGKIKVIASERQNRMVIALQAS